LNEVGLPGSDDPRNALIKNTGSVRIFDFVNKTISWNDTTTWNETFEAFGTHPNAGLGSTVALSRNGKRLAVGAPSKESDKTGYVVSFGVILLLLFMQYCCNAMFLNDFIILK